MGQSYEEHSERNMPDPPGNMPSGKHQHGQPCSPEDFASQLAHQRNNTVIATAGSSSGQTGDLADKGFKLSAPGQCDKYQTNSEATSGHGVHQHPCSRKKPSESENRHHRKTNNQQIGQTHTSRHDRQKKCNPKPNQTSPPDGQADGTCHSKQQNARQAVISEPLHVIAGNQNGQTHPTHDAPGQFDF